MITRIEALSDSAVRRRSSLLEEVARSRAAAAAEPTLESVGVPALAAPAGEAPEIEVSCVVARTSLIELDSVERDGRGSRRALTTARMTRLQKAAIGLGAAAVLLAGISLGRIIARSSVYGRARTAVPASQLARFVPPAVPTTVPQREPLVRPEARAEPAATPTPAVAAVKAPATPPREVAPPRGPAVTAAPQPRSADDFSKLTRR